MRLATKALIAGVMLLGVSRASAVEPPCKSPPPVVFEDLQDDSVAVAEAIAIGPDGTRVVATAVARRGGYSRSVAIGGPQPASGSAIPVATPTPVPMPMPASQNPTPSSHPFIVNGVVYMPTPNAR